MSLVPHNFDLARERCIDAAFSLIGDPTDWGAVIASASTLNPDEVAAELVGGQPYADNDENKLKVFRLQTKCRIAMRYRAGKPQYAEQTCAECGSRRADPVLSSDSFVGQCLHCAERELLFHKRRDHYWGSPLRLAFDTSNGTWGIAYEKDDTGRSDRTSAGIIVTGYPSRDEAMIARWAADRFAAIFNQVCPDGIEIDAESLLPIGALFAENLPMTPDQWRAFLTKNMRAATLQDAEPYSDDVSKAMKEFFKAEK